MCAVCQQGGDMCLLFAVLFVVCCFGVRVLLRVAECVRFGVCSLCVVCWLFVVGCWLLVAGWLLCVVCCSLFAGCRLLFAE